MMKYVSISGTVLMMAVVVAIGASAQMPTIEGTYTLVSRQLPDGTVVTPPQIMGLFTYTKTHRNFNIVQKGAGGKLRSFSIASTYKLTATEYSETLLFSVLSDQIAGKDVVYDLSGTTRSVPVKMEGGRIEFKPPFDQPTLIFEGDTIMATRDGRVDLWQRVP